MNLIITFLLQFLFKRATSEDSPIDPRSESFFEVKNWTGLLKRENGNQNDTFAELFELPNGGDEILIGKVDENGKLYNNQMDVSLCQRRVFQIKREDSDETESNPITWTPPSYSLVSDKQTIVSRPSPSCQRFLHCG